MEVENVFLRINFLSNASLWRYSFCFLVAILLIGELRAQKTADHLDKPVWSSKHANSQPFDEVLISLNISSDMLRNIDEVEIDVAKDLFKENILLEKKTLEVHSTNTYDLLFLRYYFSSTSDKASKIENSVVSFPIEKLPPNSNLKGAFTSINSNLDAATNSTDRIIGANSTSGLLSQNYPNPFEIHTKIQFQLPSHFRSAKIVISDMNGHQLITFDSLTPEDDQIQVGKDKLSKGIYFYHLIIDDNHISTKKMIVR